MTAAQGRFPANFQNTPERLFKVLKTLTYQRFSAIRTILTTSVRIHRVGLTATPEGGCTSEGVQTLYGALRCHSGDTRPFTRLAVDASV